MQPPTNYLIDEVRNGFDLDIPGYPDLLRYPTLADAVMTAWQHRAAVLEAAVWAALAEPDDAAVGAGLNP